MNVIKHDTISSSIERKIRLGEYRPGERLPSTRDLAEHFHCSVNTIEKSLQHLVRKELVKRIPRRGTYVRPLAVDEAKNAGRGTIAIVLPTVSHPLWSVSIRGAEDEARAEGCGLMVSSSDSRIDKLEEIVQGYVRDKVGGLIFSPVNESAEHERNVRLVQTAQAANIPVVLFDRYLNDVSTVFVGSDNHISAYTLVVRLIERGHRNILFVSNSHLSTIVERWAGYREALLRNGISYRTEYDFFLDTNEAITDEFREKLAKRLTEHDYTAIYATNDMIADAVLHSLDILGLRVPQDVSVVTHDPDANEHVRRRDITGVLQPYYEMGKVAADALVSFMHGSQPSTELVGYVCRSRIVEGSSISDISSATRPVG